MAFSILNCTYENIVLMARLVTALEKGNACVSGTLQYFIDGRVQGTPVIWNAG